MRILHLLRSLDPETGGPIEAVRLISAHHAAAGHPIEIASLDAPGDPIGDLPFPLHLLGPGKGTYGYSKRFVPWLRANHARFDAVIVNGLWQYHGYGCRQALQGTQTPYFVFPHGMLDPWFKRRYPLKHGKKWLYWPWGEYRVLRDAAAVLFTCEEERLLAAQSFALYRANAMVVGLGTNPPEVDLPAEKERLLDEFPQLRGKRILLFMGRIHPKKGCDLLLKAFARLIQSASPAAMPETAALSAPATTESAGADTRWTLLIVGPDQVGWKAELEELAAACKIAERTCWAGPRMGDSKWGALAAAELFVLPSHQENFGIAVAEALACGTPVAISNKVNIWREIQQENAGLVAEDTVDGTAAMLEAWASMPENERRTMGGNAVTCFRRHFEMQRCAEAILSAIQAVRPTLT